MQEVQWRWKWTTISASYRGLILQMVKPVSGEGYWLLATDRKGRQQEWAIGWSEIETAKRIAVGMVDKWLTESE